MSLTGKWKLNLEKCTSQTDLLKAMGRPPWQIWVIDKANEDFNLCHFKRPSKSGLDLHYFEKHVVIYLDSSILKVLSSLFRVDTDKVRYQHKLVANNKPAHHADDEKQFGECSSITSWDDNDSGFTIRWHLKRGLLKVSHHVNADDQLVVTMDLTGAHGKVTSATKVYDRASAKPDVIDPKHIEFLQ